MAKATVTDVKDQGFTREMFAALVTDETGFNALISGILDDIVPEAKEAIGTSAYDAAANLADVKRIEKYLAAGELWQRRANIVLTNREIGGQSGNSLLNMTELVRADKYREDAARIIDRLAGRVGFAASAEASSHFTEAEDA